MAAENQGAESVGGRRSRRLIGAIAIVTVIAAVVRATPLWRALVAVHDLLGVDLRVGIAGTLVALLAITWTLLRERTQTIDRLEDRLDEASRERDESRGSLDQLESDLSKVTEGQGGLWAEDMLEPVPFVPRNQRRPTFVSVFNLKGGVGKTTLSIAMGMSFAKQRLRVLLVDLDLQGSLSSAVLSERQIYALGTVGTTSELLRDPPPDDDELRLLRVQPIGFDRVEVLVADDQLEQADFRAQARFLVDRKLDPRHRFRQIFHHSEVMQDYDVVLFDCPPRLTASGVSALCASDFVVIPTQLTFKAAEAVQRTLMWLERLGAVHELSIAGVVANQVHLHASRLVQRERNVYGYLENQLERWLEVRLLKAMVKDDSALIGNLGEPLPAAGVQLVDPVVDELVQEMVL